MSETGHEKVGRRAWGGTNRPRTRTEVPAACDRGSLASSSMWVIRAEGMAGKSRSDIVP